MSHHGFVRVAAATPVLRVADCDFNARQILDLLAQASAEDAAVVVFPELAITGYTCADLFQQPTLLRSAVAALKTIVRESEAFFRGLGVIGVPLLVDDQLYNCAAVFHRGRLIGVVPKTFLPTYKEFYEARWFAPAATTTSSSVNLGDEQAPFGTDLLFEADDVEGLIVGVEICEDLWVPIPPSCQQSLHGATVLLNLSASNEVIGKASYRRQLVANQSGRCMGAYVYCACGVHESTTDVVFGGHSIIAENGNILTESPRFQRDSTLLIADVDLDRLRVDRARTTSFGLSQRTGRGDVTFMGFELGRGPAPERLRRDIDAHPFVPRGEGELRERCEEIFHIQVAGLARRLEHIGIPPVAIGVSGGLDSTLALLVACKTFDLLGVERSQIRGLTMPGFGTSNKTRGNAKALMEQLHVSAREIDIRSLCLEQMRALHHKPFGFDSAGMSVEQFQEALQRVPSDKRHDLIFENVQARMRTSLLMNTGFVIGTGDVSELALGWCTYNADHMSMYNPNSSIPKTLVKFLVRWVALNEFDGAARQTLLEIVGTPISPELLPTTAEGHIGQSTEGTIGPYELHDFFLFHFLRYGAPPEKILYLARQAKFDQPWTREEIAKWLKVFLKRFFCNQFKRSCLPDGPKVGSISLSPRGDWRMPSDAQANEWLKWGES